MLGREKSLSPQHLIDRTIAAEVITKLITALSKLIPPHPLRETDVRPSNLVDLIDRLGSILGGVFETIVKTNPLEAIELIKKLSIKGKESATAQ